tara:strand:- start:3965 stop:5053 length:1089 start_codon:yes stop_codon:yes gene_type:complete
MGLLDNIGNKLSSMSDDDRRRMALGLASGFAGMSGNPNAGNIMQGIGRQQDALALRRKEATAANAATSQNNATLAALQQAGVPAEVLTVAKANPALFKEIASSFVTAKMGGGDMVKFSGIQTDPVTGAQYVVMSDPNTKGSTRVDVSGATQQTPQQKLDMEGKATSKAADIAQAKEVGFAAFGRAGAIDESLTKLESAREAVNNGASSGFLAKFVPSFNAATTQLRAAANQLGIDIINSATFGALSEKELQLALSTGLDLSLQGEELKNHIADKINAQTKLRNELVKQAKVLTKGDITYSAYIQQYGSSGAREVPVQNYQTPQNAGSGATGTGGYTLSADQIKKMTPEQKAKFTSLTGIRLP